MSFQTLEQILALPQLAVASGEFGQFIGGTVYGYNAAVGTTEATVWPENTLHAHPASASTMTVSSDDAADASAGTGAREVLITGLDSNYDVAVETVTMNGTTAVTTANSYLRINELEVITAGTGEQNAGVVFIGTGTVTSGKPANVFGLIDKEENLSHHSFWTVPRGFTAYIPFYSVTSYGSASSVADCRFRVRRDSFLFRTIHRFKVTRGTTPKPFFVPIKLEERTDFQLLARADTGNIDVGCDINLIISANET